MTKGQVYFIECSGRIKVGFSTDVQSRLRKFSTGSAFKFSLIGAIDGTKALERAIHQQLAVHRAHGEWFEDCSAVRLVIVDLLTSGPSAIGFIEPPVRNVAPHEVSASFHRPEPSVIHPIIVRIEACAERYLGPGAPYPQEVRAARTPEGFSLIYSAVTAVEQLIGSQPEISDVLPEAAAIATRLESDIAALFCSERV